MHTLFFLHSLSVPFTNFGGYPNNNWHPPLARCLAPTQAHELVKTPTTAPTVDSGLDDAWLVLLNLLSAEMFQTMALLLGTRAL